MLEYFHGEGTHQLRVKALAGWYMKRKFVCGLESFVQNYATGAYEWV